MPNPPEAKQIERWFVRRGYATLLEGTGLGSKTAVRAVAPLVALFLLTMILVVPSDTERTWWPTIVSLVAIVASWIGGNLLRRRSPLAKIARVGWLEAIVFVAVPALAAAAVDPRTSTWSDVIGELPTSAYRLLSAMVVGMLQVTLLIGVLAVIRFRIFSVGSLVMRHLVGGLGETATVMARTLPLLLGVITFIFFTAEIWQSLGQLPPFPYVFVLGAFIALSGAFLARREHLDLDRLAAFSGPEDVHNALHDTELAGLPSTVLRSGPQVCPLGPAQERSLILVAAASRLVVAVVVGLAVLGFFLLLGVISVNAEVVRSWLGHPGQVIWSVTTLKHTYDLTVEHLKVTGFLAVFSGFYYAVVSATDPTLRKGLRDSTEDTVRHACAARLILLQGRTA